MPPSFDHLASTQLGLITRRQLRSLGWTDRQVTYAIASGDLIPIRRAVFRIRGAPGSPLHPVLAPILEVPQAELVGAQGSAALVWDLKHVEHPDVPTLLGEIRVRLEGVRVVRSRAVSDLDRTRHLGVPVTTAARTICDLAAVVHPVALGSCLDDARRRRLVNLPELAATLRRIRASVPNFRGLVVLESMLADRAGQPTAGRSRAELDLLPILRRAGVDGIVQDYEVWVDGVRYFLDFAIPELKIAIEYDPFETHARTRAMWIKHNRRRAALEAEGWIYVQIDEQMTPDEVVKALITAVLRRKCQ